MTASFATWLFLQLTSSLATCLFLQMTSSLATWLFLQMTSSLAKWLFLSNFLLTGIQETQVSMDGFFAGCLVGLVQSMKIQFLYLVFLKCVFSLIIFNLWIFYQLKKIQGRKSTVTWIYRNHPWWKRKCIWSPEFHRKLCPTVKKKWRFSYILLDNDYIEKWWWD